MHKNYYSCGNTMQIGDVIWADGTKICICDIYYEKSDVFDLYVPWLNVKLLDPLGKNSTELNPSNLIPFHAYKESYLLFRSSDVVRVGLFILSAGMYFFLKNKKKYYVSAIVCKRNNFYCRVAIMGGVLNVDDDSSHYIVCFDDDFQTKIFSEIELSGMIECIH